MVSPRCLGVGYDSVVHNAHVMFTISCSSSVFDPRAQIQPTDMQCHDITLVVLQAYRLSLRTSVGWTKQLVSTPAEIRLHSAMSLVRLRCGRVRSPCTNLHNSEKYKWTLSRKYCPSANMSPLISPAETRPSHAPEARGCISERASRRKFFHDRGVSLTP